MESEQGKLSTRIVPVVIKPRNDSTAEAIGDIATTGATHFKDLPLNARQRIYDYVTNPTQVLTIWRIHNSEPELPAGGEQTQETLPHEITPKFFIEQRPDLTIFRTCGAIYLEAKSSFSASNTFNFRRTEDMYDFLMYISPSLRDRIKHIEFDFTRNSLLDPLAPLLACGSLVSIRVRLHDTAFRYNMEHLDILKELQHVDVIKLRKLPNHLEEITAPTQGHLGQRIQIYDDHIRRQEWKGQEEINDVDPQTNLMEPGLGSIQEQIDAIEISPDPASDAAAAAAFYDVNETDIDTNYSFAEGPEDDPGPGERVHYFWIAVEQGLARLIARYDLELGSSTADGEESSDDNMPDAA
ncbi:MAG: hypothetical protein M4579_004028 [Chaenotheca gracillima]|nr:MAG: hypothetical protein M4579_004028 [Chaenotheca gracillima]